MDQTRLTGNSENGDFYERIAKDSKQALIQLVSEAGHGKTSSLRTIVQYVQKHHPDIKFKIFDVSQAWYHQAPSRYRQLITMNKWNRGEVANIEDCVYEIGKLTKEERRAFVGMIVADDYNRRYQAKLDGVLDDYTTLIYVFEEANIYFDSYSFRSKDPYSDVFQKFASVGRNYKMRGFLVATAEEGEISPSLRRRTRKIYGKVVSGGDLRMAKRLKIKVDLTEMPQYHFHYYGTTVKVPDLVKDTPLDYEHVPESVPRKENDWVTFFKYAGLTIFILYMFFSYFVN